MLTRIKDGKYQEYCPVHGWYNASHIINGYCIGCENDRMEALEDDEDMRYLIDGDTKGQGIKKGRV